MQPSASHTSKVFLKTPKFLYNRNSTMHKDEVFYFFYKMLRKSHTLKTCDVSSMLYGAIINLN